MKDKEIDFEEQEQSYREYMWSEEHRIEHPGTALNTEQQLLRYLPLMGPDGKRHMAGDEVAPGYAEVMWAYAVGSDFFGHKRLPSWRGKRARVTAMFNGLRFLGVLEQAPDNFAPLSFYYQVKQ